MIQSVLKDVRLALRVLAKSPGFTAVTLLTLAVAIGANTAIFSVVDGVLLRPLPFPDENELVTVALDASGAGVPELPFSDRGYWHFRENNRSFDELGGYLPRDWALTSDGQPLQTSVGLMTLSAFELLGVAPFRGRFPSAEEDVPDGPLVVLMSHGLWTDRYGSNPEVIGSTIELNGQTREVIGIMPPGYPIPSPRTDLWAPIQLDPASPNFGGHYLTGIARLRDGVPAEAAVTDAEGLIQRFEEAGYGPQWLSNVFTGQAVIRTLKEDIVGDSRQPLLILLGTVGFVLLIACSNVANLFLVRAETRTRETAVRSALGAGRLRLIRYVLTESVVLSLVGGLLGLGLAYLGTRLLVSIGPASIPRLHEIGLSRSVLGFTAAVSIFAGLLFGVMPALRVGSKRMLSALRDGGRGTTGGRHRARSALVVTQVALALVLLVGSGLMVRSFQRLRAVDPGFDAREVLTFSLSLSPARYTSGEETAQFFDDLLGRLEALPGVASAAAINTLPLTGGGAVLATVIEDFPIGPDDFPPAFPIRRVTPGYFETLRIPVVEGRAFEPRDHQERLGTAIISAALKEQYWPDVSPMGKRLQASGAPAEIIGVVGDVHDAGLTEPAEQMIYLPMLDSVGGGAIAMTVTVRTSVQPESLVGSIRQEIGAVDPMLPITDVETMTSVVGDSISRTSFTMSLLVLAAVVALFLGSIGIYGVVSYVVSQRTSEIGVRLALGADAAVVRSMVFRQGLTLGVLGVVIGLITAAAMGRLLTALLFGVSPFDPITFAGGAVIFLLVAALATWVPARRASGIAPAVALRQE